MNTVYLYIWGLERDPDPGGMQVKHAEDIWRYRDTCEFFTYISHVFLFPSPCPPVPSIVTGMKTSKKVCGMDSF